MPIEYRFDHSRKLIIVTAAGSLSADDLLNHQIQVHNDPSHDPTYSQLNDMRTADLTSIDADCVEVLSQRAIPKVGTKIAFVVRNEIAKELARMFESLRDGTGEEFRVFRDLDAAFTWLESAVDRPGTSQNKRSGKRRAALRVSAESDPGVPDHVDFITSKVAGTGQILNVSTSGAFIARPSRSLEVGTEAEFYFIQPKTGQQLQAQGVVIRSEDMGFAVQFTRIERELEQLVFAAAGKAKNRK